MSFFNAGLQVPKDENIVLNGSTSGSIKVLANGTTTAGTIFQLPSSNGTANQVLKTDGNGVLSYTDVTVSNLAADDISIGDAAVTITTSTGDVTINSNTGSVKIANSLTNVVDISGSAVTSTVNITPNTNDGAALGSSTLEWSDLYLADGGNIYLGNDQDVIITHVPDTGLLLNSTSNLQFRDSALKVYSSVDGQLDITADVELQIVAPTVDINASSEVNISNALTVGGAVNFDNTTQSTSTTTGALIIDGGVGVAKDINVGGNVSVSKGFVVGVDSITANTGSGAPTALIDSTNYAAVKNINISNANPTYYTVTSTGVSNGQMLHLFYQNSGAGNSRIDFSSSNLFAGSGKATNGYLTFTGTGQSATLIYIQGGTATSSEGWRIINTGGSVS